MSATQEGYIAMLEALKRQVDMACNLMRDRSWIIDDRFAMVDKKLHMIIGDFEIRCINPEQYGLPPRQPET